LPIGGPLSANLTCRRWWQTAACVPHPLESAAARRDTHRESRLTVSNGA
jgi:hypothetical protein